ncbi:hypothetical protein G8E10_09395 [Rhizobiaceae bacterium CRRU44]|uniref:Uncharacterized protein n=1 Tax=Ferranicluibacter rubi TaxID=2715133 RepID=A0AA43ZFA8_9HYPH|nr:hypothetical protein [Ferranicluibacter rubi]NHT75893.1 hypothetical protein [Ferranicluibacter rubi]NHT75953.1 hypothetical protein [Ferranicluibacter rubi]
MRNKPFSCDYDFDGIYPITECFDARGIAELVDDECDGFYVASITFDDGVRLIPRGNGYLGLPHAVKDGIFAIIADEIQKSEHAAEHFHTALNESRLPDPDRAYDERRDHLAMGWCAA